MATVVSLRDVVDAMDALTQGATSYLNQVTTEIRTFSEDELALAESEGLEDGLPEWQRDLLPAIREVVESDRWLQLPTSFEINDWSIMEQFARSREDAEQSNDLLDAIRGMGAFRLFRRSIKELGISDEWFRYREAAYVSLAREWLESHGLSYE